MSRPSTSETGRRKLLDRLRDSKSAKSIAALGLAATLLSGCGKSTPENPCVNQDAGILLEGKNGGEAEWYCANGTRTDGKHNPGSEDLERRMGGNVNATPTPIDIPTTTPAPIESSKTLTPEEQLQENIAKETAVKNSYEYIVDGEKMTYDKLVEHFIIPSNVTDPKLVTNLLEQHLNELASGGNTKEEYLRNDAAFDKAQAENGYSIPAVEYRKYYADAFAETLVHPEIDANTDYIGRNIDPAYQKPLYREYIFTRDNAKPFNVKHDLTLIEGQYLPADDSVARTYPEMGLRVKYDLTKSGVSGKTKVENGTESTEQMIYLRVLDGRWVVLYTDQIEQ